MSDVQLRTLRPGRAPPQALFATSGQATTSFSTGPVPRYRDPVAPAPDGYNAPGHPSGILDPWTSTLISVTELFFPSSRQLVLLRQPFRHGKKARLGDNEVHSDVVASMLLYFNAVYMLFWAPVIVAALAVKYDGLSEGYRVANLVMYIAVAMMECARLFLGCSGNLLEKVPELALSWVLTTFVQLPVALFLAFNETAGMAMRPEERGANIPLVLLLLLEVGFMRRATNKLIGGHVARMQLNDFDDIALLDTDAVDGLAAAETTPPPPQQRPQQHDDQGRRTSTAARRLQEQQRQQQSLTGSTERLLAGTAMDVGRSQSAAVGEALRRPGAPANLPGGIGD